jgi:hypothetical protein
MTTWNPADKSADIVLSGGDLVATKSEVGPLNYDWARSTTSKAAGKVYFECIATNMVNAFDASYAAAGTAILASDVNNYLGSAADTSAYYADGSVYVADAVVATLSAYTTGAVIGCALDLDAGKGWYSEDGVFASGDPVAGTGEHFTFTPGTTLFAGFTLIEDTDAITASFSATPPAGFDAWDAGGGGEGGEVGPSEPALTYGLPPLSPARVRAKWDEIEEIDRRIKAKEAAERESVRKQEEAKRQLAELAEKKRQTKTIAERRRKLEARIDAYQSEIADLRMAMVAMLDEIERARVEVELQQTIADRRRRMLLLIAAAS